MSLCVGFPGLDANLCRSAVFGGLFRLRLWGVGFLQLRGLAIIPTARGGLCTCRPRHRHQAEKMGKVCASAQVLLFHRRTLEVGLSAGEQTS